MKTSPGCAVVAEAPRARSRITVGNVPSWTASVRPCATSSAVAVAERGRVVHRVADDRRVGAAHDHERHLVGDRRERVLDHLERDRDRSRRPSGIELDVDVAVARRASRRQPGGTTQVESYSSTSSGPSRGAGEQRRARDADRRRRASPCVRAEVGAARAARRAGSARIAGERVVRRAAVAARPRGRASRIETTSIGSSAEPWP